MHQKLKMQNVAFDRADEIAGQLREIYFQGIDVVERLDSLDPLTERAPIKELDNRAAELRKEASQLCDRYCKALQGFITKFGE